MGRKSRSSSSTARVVSAVAHLSLLARLIGRSNAMSPQESVVADNKSYKICSVLGGLDITRLISSSTRSFFQGAIEDVELIREYVSESAYNGGLATGGGDSDLDALDVSSANILDELAATLDANARGLPEGSSTLDANLGYCDDRPDRRIERYVSTGPNEPLVGNKADDMAILNAVGALFPWIVDRKSNEASWHIRHLNGRSEGDTKEPFRFDALYTAAWIGTYGEAWSYYPPLRVYGHPFGFGDVLGPAYQSHKEAFVLPNLPENNLDRVAFFTKPYPDTAVPGLSLITAMAPIYYTGTFRDNIYDNTYLASTGVDIAVSSVSTLLDVLEGRLSRGSFGVLVDSNFNIIVISQAVVEKLYPPRTGFEESRVEYSLADGSIVHDRRNQTYLGSDTILQPLTDLDNANWDVLRKDAVEDTTPGERGYSKLDLTLTGDVKPKEFYAMYERWAYVADWVLLVLAPVSEVQSAIKVGIYMRNSSSGGNAGVTAAADGSSLDHVLSAASIELDAEQGAALEGNAFIITNQGTLDVVVRTNVGPRWVEFRGAAAEELAVGRTLTAGENLEFEFTVITEDLEPGTSSSVISFSVVDDGYPDCFYDTDLTLDVTVRVTNEQQLNQIDGIIPAGLTLMAIVVCCSIGFAVWVYCNRSSRVVKASQPGFLILVCFGILVMGTAIIPMSIDDGSTSARGCSIACMAVPWLTSMGFCVAFAALFSKIWRINKIFHSARHCRKVKVTERDVLIPFAVLFTLNFAILLAWTLADPLRWVRLPVDDSSWNTYGTCKSDGKAAIAFLALILAINFAALIFACFQAYRARGIGDEYSESKYIGIAVVSWLQVFIVGVPLMFLVNTDPKASYFLKSALVFVVCMSMLLLIFIPKVLFMRRQRRDKQAAQGRTNEITSTSLGSGGPGTLESEGSANRFIPINQRESDLSNQSGRGSIGLRIVQMPSDKESLEKVRKLEERIIELERMLKKEEESGSVEFLSGDCKQTMEKNHVSFCEASDPPHPGADVLERA